MAKRDDRTSVYLLLVIGLVAIVAVIAIVRPGTVQTSETGNDENVAGLATAPNCDLTALQRNGQTLTYTVKERQLTIKTTTDGTKATVTVNGQATPPLATRQATTLPDGTTITILNILQARQRVRFCLNLGQATPPTQSSSFRNIRSVTFYDYPATSAQRHIHLAQSLPTIKDTGFNTVWLVTPWAIMDPKPLQAPAQYNEAEFAQLRSTLQLLKQNNMKAIIGLNYLGPGWAPQGIDACEWARNQTQYAAFEEYTKDFLLRIRDYKDDVYILVFTENSFPCDSEPWTRGNEHALLLQQRLGSLPTRLPADLRRDFKIGYHDNLLITEGWSTLSPIRDPNPFDFLSTVAYGLESSTNEQITAALDLKVARFQAKYPTAPLIIGEYGASACGQDANQARVDKAITSYAVQKGLGLNLWGWRPLNNGAECENNAANGLSITNMDGTNKVAVAAVKSVLRPGLTFANDLSTSREKR